ncbi:CDP-alcohol phosphatidyltransferase family protein [Chitinivibrio alkaliphilus]|uniref:CDP-diacylglycerol--glycerol-3-phosphate 3-phosphatidyltransferase n=1 Tax=Chitinivibrio alkaliphilus ACht1 TaxID=1313304 RepID=U7D961_9BACT|nr:CDP-alcohol phosphatidyltransferase family protein [Chitinivibrio alkaliphilus]ERP32121.1 CDP-diacylglycerol--glycerol-3-phosphate 3-phosphatidyltransferase [Chitinivibrio alkaliphilus ACht1]
MKLFVNFITLLRLPCISAVVILNLFWNPVEYPAIFISTLVLIALCGITDYLDGYLARRFSVESNFGAHADPLLDKLFFTGIFPVLVFLAALNCDTFHALLLVLTTVVFSFRDQLVSFFRMIGDRQGISPRASMWGKLRTATAFPGIILIYSYLGFPHEYGSFFVPRGFIIAVEMYLITVTLVTFFLYLVQYFPALRREME